MELKRGRTRFTLYYLILVVLITFTLRVLNLNTLPLSLSLDEATNGLDALQLFRLGRFTPFLQNNFGRETLFFYVQAAALHLYGLSFFSLRFASALAGTITIPLLYQVGRRLQLDNLLDYRPNRHQASKNSAAHIIRSPTSGRLQMMALLAATGLAISYWHLFFSRVGLRAILLPPLLLAVIWCFWQGWYSTPHPQQRSNWPRILWLIGAGFLLGLTFYTYLAARLLPLLFSIFVVIELSVDKSTDRKRAIANFVIFGLIAALVIIPLALYFQQNPQAFNSRTQAISILASDTPLNTFTTNMKALLQLHFGGTTWLEQWPALNLFTTLGFLSGLLVCIYHLKKPAARFLLLWWAIGTLPVLISIQVWSRQTTILRGLVAWPAIFLISAVGLLMLTSTVHQMARKFLNLQWANLLFRPAITFWLLLTIGGLTTTYHYFSIWATTYNNFSDHPAYMARYLNRQRSQLTLTPLAFYSESVANFLLQAHYPTLTNIEAGRLQTLLEASQSAVYLLPHRSSAVPTFVLLSPGPNGRGTAYLLPPLTGPQIEALATNTQTTLPLGTVLDSEREPIAHIYPLTAGDLAFLPAAPESAGQGQKSWPLQSIQANFNQEIRLTGYQVTPAVIKPGQTIFVSLNWQAQQPIDGDYNLFIHLFNVAQGQRYGQVNIPLSGILFDAHRWPTGLTVPDTHTFNLPPDAPAGVYRFEVGLYQASTGQRLPVTLAPAVHEADDKIILGKFHVQPYPPPAPQYLLPDLHFEDSIALLGLDWPATSLQPGQPLTYSLHWQALTSPLPNLKVFNHLLDREGNLQAQQDNLPQNGRYPTTWWASDEIIVDSYNWSLPPDLEAGQYTLRIGLYQPETGQRLTLTNPTQDFVDLPVLITIQD